MLRDGADRNGDGGGRNSSNSNNTLLSKYTGISALYRPVNPSALGQLDSFL